MLKKKKYIVQGHGIFQSEGLFIIYGWLETE
jgi:hypothetical protein